MAENWARGKAKSLKSLVYFLSVAQSCSSRILALFLQTIYGEILPIQSNNDVAGLTRFLTDRLLGNPDIANEFAHPQVPGLYREGEHNHIQQYFPKRESSD